MSSKKVIMIHGSHGRMGQLIQDLLKSKGHTVITIDRHGRGDHKSFSSLLKNQSIDVLIDFTSDTGLRLALAWAQKTKTPLMSGSTGLKPSTLLQIKKAAKKIPVLWAPNTSVGIAILKKAVSLFSQLEETFDFYIEDIHHKNKKDAPSGTALALQQAVPLKKKKISIASARIGGVIGQHRFVAASAEEVLTFEHLALHRAVFAQGAIRAALWLAKKPSGYYSFEDVLR